MKNTRALGVGRDLSQLLGQRLGGLVGERVERGVGAQRAYLGGDGVGHLGAAVADRVVPQAGHAVDQLAAVLVPHQRSFAALDADESVSGGLGEGVEERCRHVATVSNRLVSPRVAPTVPPDPYTPSRGGVGAPNSDNDDSASRQRRQRRHLRSARSLSGDASRPRQRRRGSRCCVRLPSCWPLSSRSAAPSASIGGPTRSTTSGPRPRSSWRCKTSAYASCMPMRLPARRTSWVARRLRSNAPHTSTRSPRRATAWLQSPARPQPPISNNSARPAACWAATSVWSSRPEPTTVKAFRSARPTSGRPTGSSATPTPTRPTSSRRSGRSRPRSGHRSTPAWPPRTAPACGCSSSDGCWWSRWWSEVWWLARRFRRLINIPIAIAGDCCCCCCWSIGGSIQAGAVSDADAAVSGPLAGADNAAQARAAAFEARSQEALTLINRGNGAANEANWQIRQQHRAAGARSRNWVASSRSTRAADSYSSYRDAHAEIRALDDGGNWDQAVAVSLGRADVGRDQRRGRVRRLRSDRRTDRRHAGRRAHRNVSTTQRPRCARCATSCSSPAW